MNIFSVAAFIMLLSMGSMVVGAEQGAASVKPQAENGYIQLIRGNGQVDCQYDFVTSQHYLSENNDGCSNDVNYSFRLFNVPSATRFILADAGDCSSGENFWFEFKTIKYETNTDVIALTDIASLEVGAVVSPGLRLINKVPKSPTGQIRGKLSCVKIIRSE